MEKFDNDNGWNEWRNFVLKELQRLNKNYEILNSYITDLQINTKSFEKEMNIKSSIFGIIGGIIPIAIMIAVYLLTKKG